jgi:hypothetical protein
MIKSYTESGGTTLSTNWADIGKGESGDVSSLTPLSARDHPDPPARGNGGQAVLDHIPIFCI